MSYPILDIDDYLGYALSELRGADEVLGEAWSDPETGVQHPLPAGVERAAIFWGKAVAYLEDAKRQLAEERVAEQARYDEDEAHWTR